MAEPENRTLRILGDIRTAIKTLDQKNGKRFDVVDKDMATLRSNLDDLRHAMTGRAFSGIAPPRNSVRGSMPWKSG